MRTIKAKAVIQNKPDYPLEKYIVARAVEGQLWFWGTWDDLNTALIVAKACENGCVVENEENKNKDEIFNALDKNISPSMRTIEEGFCFRHGGQNDLS